MQHHFNNGSTGYGPDQNQNLRIPDFQETGRSTNDFTNNFVLPPAEYRLPVDINAGENSSRGFFRPELALPVGNVK